MEDKKSKKVVKWTKDDLARFKFSYSSLVYDDKLYPHYYHNAVKEMEFFEGLGYIAAIPDKKVNILSNRIECHLSIIEQELSILLKLLSLAKDMQSFDHELIDRLTETAELTAPEIEYYQKQLAKYKLK